MAEPIDWATFAANPYKIESENYGLRECSQAELLRRQHCMEAKIFCSYCGKKMGADLDGCPNCGAPTES